MSSFTSRINPPAQQDNGLDSWETEKVSTFVLKIDPPAPKKKKNNKKKNRTGMILDHEASKWHPSHEKTGVPAGYYEQDDIDCRDMGFIRFKTTVDPQPETHEPEVDWPELVQKQAPQPVVTQPQDNIEKTNHMTEEDSSLSHQPPVRHSWAQIVHGQVPQQPQPEAPQLEAPHPETPQFEAPQPEAPQLEAPQPEAPQLEAPQPEAPQLEASQPEAPQPEAYQPEAPQLEAPQP